MRAYIFIADNNFAEIATAQAARIARLTQDDVHVFLEGLGEGSRFREFSSPSIHYHYDRLASFLPPGLPESSRFPKITYCRIIAPLLLGEYQRVVYLDSDVCFLRPDDAIWEVELPHGIGAVHDAHMLGDLTPQRDQSKATWLRSLGIGSSRYFNSGVLAIDPKKWGELDLLKKLADYATRYEREMRFADQDFLNYEFQGRWTELSPRFNFQCRLLDRGYARSIQPSLIHFNAPDRPWQNGWMSHHTPAGKAFRKLYAIALHEAGYSIDRYHRPRKLRFAYRRVPAHFRRIIAQMGCPKSLFPFANRGWSNTRREIQRYFDEAFAEKLYADLDDRIEPRQIPLSHCGYRFEADESDYWNQFLTPKQHGMPLANRK